MTNELKEIDLGQAGLNFLRSVLMDSGTLGRAVGDKLNVPYKITTYLPAAVDKSGLFHFGLGGKFLNIRGQNSLCLKADDVLKKKIKDNLQDRDDVIFIENRLAKSQDVWLSKRKSFVFFIEESQSVVHFLRGPCGGADIEILCSESQSVLPTVGIIFKLSTEEMPQNNERVNGKRVESIAKNVVRAIFIGGIYDGESFLWWEPQK